MQRDLVERARRGDKMAYSELASAAFHGLYALAYRILRDADRTDDAIQSCLMRAWQQLPRLRDPDRFDAWLRRLLVNACHDEWRRRSREGSLRFLTHDQPPGRDVAMDLAARDELEGAFRSLSVEHRAVVVMTYYMDLSTREIAETLGIPVGTVRSRLHYAMGAMRAVLEADARPVPLAAEGGRR